MYVEGYRKGLDSFLYYLKASPKHWARLVEISHIKCSRPRGNGTTAFSPATSAIVGFELKHVIVRALLVLRVAAAAQCAAQRRRRELNCAFLSLEAAVLSK